MADLDDAGLLAALGVEVTLIKAGGHTAREERLMAGFEDILRFVETHGRPPQFGEDRDIFERLYAVRLDRLRALPDALALLARMDASGLLAEAVGGADQGTMEALDDTDVLAALGTAPLDGEDINQLRHVRSFEARQAAEDVANRTRCADFGQFKPLFEAVALGQKAGTWLTKPFAKDASIEQGDFFIIGGQMAYVAEIQGGGTTKDGRDNPRLRVIFDNQTESNLLLRSLSRSLYPDGQTPVGRRIIKLDAGPLFGDTLEPDDIVNGTIYVLRSLSTEPFVAQHRELIHKIGITGGKVETRIANAEHEATYLLAKVEIVATYKLANLHRTRMEHLFHRIFQNARLDLTIQDRFGNPVKPREWFLVPLPAIDEAVKRIQAGSIGDYWYDPAQAALVRR